MATLRNCTKLEDVALVNCSALGQLPDLLPSRSLRHFDLASVDLEDLAPLLAVPQLAELEYLSLRYCNCHSLRGIGRWAATLHTISIWDNKRSIDLNALVELPNLMRLNLGIQLAKDLRFVRKLNALRELDVYSTNIANISDLAGMEFLTIYARRGQTIIGAEKLGKGSKVVRLR